MKKIITALMICLTAFTYGQGYTSVEMTRDEIIAQLKDMNRDYSYGNACEDGEPWNFWIEGDWDMGGNTIELLNIIVQVEGKIINQGTILFACDNANVIEHDMEVVDTPLNPSNPGGNPFGNLDEEDPNKVTLDVEEVEDIDFNIKVYPNPATNYFTVSGDGLSTIEVYDMSGRLRKSFKTAVTTNTISADNLSSGLYLIVITTDNNKRITKKLIIN
jgi:hypothetical protein